MTCGRFEDASREYVITEVKTPVKWINYVGGLEFGGIVDHTGGALICSGDPALNRITKVIPQLPASDFRGSTIYVKMIRGSTVDLWSPFYTPTLAPTDSWECRVGLGYNRWTAQRLGVTVTVTVFVSGRVFVQDIMVTNDSQQPWDIEVVPVVEFSHFDALKQLTNADWVPQTMTLKAHSAGGRTVLEQYAFMKRGSAVNWFTTSIPASSFDGDRSRFLGRSGYGTWARPGALEGHSLTNSECNRGDTIGALQVTLGSMAPGESKRFAALLGQAQTVDQGARAAEALAAPADLDRAFAALAAEWDQRLSVLHVETPDPAFNSMVNIHNPRQCHTTKNWSRDLSLYQLGLGGRGMGYRDSSQDVLGAMAMLPEGCRDLLVKILSVQRRDGSAMHQFYASTLEASVGDSHEYPDRPHWYGDDHLWPVFGVLAYVAETGDLAWLDTPVPYYEKAGGVPVESGSVYDHLKRALAFTWDHRGTHGLPLLGFADWNDTVNLPTGAESVFLAHQFGKALADMKVLAAARDDTGYLPWLDAAWEAMRAAVEAHAWDGEWYVRYFDEKGAPIGTRTSEKGRIWINSNTWAVLSGLAPADRAVKAMDSVQRHLNTRYGLKLSAPGYDGFDRRVGGVTTYPPGAKENGGVFLHTNPWAMMAEARLGRGDRAFQYYTQINPAAKNDEIERYEAEPYCYPQNILGDEHPQFGLARNTWLSGTASWTYVAAVQHLLGLRPEMGGLRIDPCLPSAWPGFTATRAFRGATYAITVTKPVGLCRGVKRVTVNGKDLEGTLVLPQGPGTHSVVVTMGS